MEPLSVPICECSTRYRGDVKWDAPWIRLSCDVGQLTVDGGYFGLDPSEIRRPPDSPIPQSVPKHPGGCVYSYPS